MLEVVPVFDGWLAHRSQIGLVGYGVISLKADQHGSGKHQWQVAEFYLVEYAKVNGLLVDEICGSISNRKIQFAYLSQIVYGPLIFTTKLCILLLYLRVLDPAARSKTRLFIYSLIWGNFLFYLAGTLIKIFQCTPINKAWDQSIPGRCVPIEIFILIASVISVISDFSILLLPFVCVWQLQLKTDKKLGVSAMFLAGSL